MSLDVCLYEQVKCPHCSGSLHETEVFHANITHNLGCMAAAAGIYEHVWRPDECGVLAACDIIQPLRNAIEWMENNGDLCKEHDAPNGWGTYEQFLPWIRKYLSACEKHPQARVEVSR